MDGTKVYSDTEYFYLMKATEMETQTLQVDMTSGGYKYRVQNELWVPPEPEMPPTLPDHETAKVLVRQWFARYGEGLPGAFEWAGEPLVKTEKMVEVEMGTPGSGTPIEQELLVDVALSYGYEVEAQVKTSQGIEQEPLSIVGPGARTKVYLGDGGKILGVQGGSRDYQETGEYVPIVDADVAWGWFKDDPTIALATIPWAFDDAEQMPDIEPTLGYYEEPQTQGQQELVPTWIFSTTLKAGGEILEDGVWVYVPAAEQYLPPEVTIVAPSDGSEFRPGEMVTFEGHVMQYGLEPFTYEWYSSHDGFLGSGDTIMAPLTGAVEKGDLISHTISLQVTDANGQEGADSVAVFVRTAIYLPIVLRGE
jgi:hypothetical protein